MSSVSVATSMPTLRISSSRTQEASTTTTTAPPTQTEPSSARIQPPESAMADDRFFWTYTEEPHRSRRQAIIKAHPEVRNPDQPATILNSPPANASLNWICRSQNYADPSLLRNTSFSAWSHSRSSARTCCATHPCSIGDSSSPRT